MEDLTCWVEPSHWERETFQPQVENKSTGAVTASVFPYTENTCCPNFMCIDFYCAVATETGCAPKPQCEFVLGTDLYYSWVSSSSLAWTKEQQCLGIEKLCKTPSCMRIAPDAMAGTIVLINIVVSLLSSPLWVLLSYELCKHPSCLFMIPVLDNDMTGN